MIMKHIVIIPNPNKDVDFAVTENLSKKLNSLGAEVHIERKYASKISSCVNVYDVIPSCAELIVVVGGDGSILDASVTAIENNIPLLGVNLGKVGYLSEVEPDNLDILTGLFSFLIYFLILLGEHPKRAENLRTKFG